MSIPKIPHSKPWISDEDQQAVCLQLKSGQIARGSAVRRFEAEVATFSGFKHALATPSGTAALEVILRALQVVSGDEVILPTYVCHSVETAVRSVGANPVLCDVTGPWKVTASDVFSKVNEKTKAVILVHTFGIDAFDKAFADLNVPVIEDCCQAFGLKPTHNSRRNLAFFSFNATKCLTTGEGGMAVFNDSALYAQALELKKKNSPLTVMSDLQAALGLSQLSRYQEMVRRRREVAKLYLESLPGEILLKTREIESSSVFFRFPVTVGKTVEEEMAQAEQHDGISLRRGVDALLHRKNGMPDEDFPGASSLFQTTLSLPIYPTLSRDEQGRIIFYLGGTHRK